MAEETGGENSPGRTQKPAFQTLAINIPGIVYRVYVRERNRMMFFNDMLEKMTGYKPGEIRRGEVCSIDPIILSEDRIHVLEVVKGALKENKPFEVEYRITHKNGGIRYFFERGQNFYGSDGKPEIIDGVILDISDRKRSEMAISESKEQFRSVLENSVDAMYRRNLKTGEFDYMSPIFAELTGFTVDELRIMGIDAILQRVHPADRQQVAEGMEHILKCGKGLLEYRFLTKDGEYRWLAATLSVVNDKEGCPLHRVGVIRDITAQKQTEETVLESRKLLLQLAENVKEVFFVVSPNWMEVLYVSPAYESVWGRSCKSLYEQPRSWLEAVVDEDRGRTLKEINKKSAGDFSDPKFPEYRISTPDSSVRWILARAFPVRNEKGEIYRIAGIAEDITERKKLEKELRSSRDELEIRVAERTTEVEKINANLNESIKRLDQLNKELQDFAYVASHDLREPLRKVRTFGNILAGKVGVSLDETSKDYLKRMQKAAARMQDLLDSLLSYSRVTTTAKPIKETNLEESVEKALSNLEILIKEKNACVEVAGLPTVRADGVQMIQLFQNLIGNALKFNREGQPPYIRVFAERVSKGSSAYEIRVEDNGIGFEQRYINKIFLPFQRLHGRGSKYEGLGMGLAICKKIVERHGGTLTATSELSHGSTFIVTLPATNKILTY